MSNQKDEAYNLEGAQESSEIMRELDASSLPTFTTHDMQVDLGEKKKDVMVIEDDIDGDQKMYTDLENQGNHVVELVSTEDTNAIIPGLDIPETLTMAAAPGISRAEEQPAGETESISNPGHPSESTNLSIIDSILSKHGLVSVDSGDDSSSEESSTTSEASSSDSESSSPSSDSEEDDSSSSDSTTAKHSITKTHDRLRNQVTQMIEQGDQGDSSEDEGPKTHGLATAHEITIPQVIMPSITEVSEEEPIELIGEVKSVIENVVVIKSKEHGMHRVLDTDSLLVLGDRKVLGFVFETFGPLTNPFYSVRFPTSSDIPGNIASFSPSEGPVIQVYYCPQQSNFAYTAKIRLHRGNDASNIYDEEVGEDELEFSDDEAEMEWKRGRKEGKVGEKRKRHAPSVPSQANPSLGQDPSTLPYDEEGASHQTTLQYDDPYADPCNDGASTSRPESFNPHPENRLPDRRIPQNRGYSRGRGRGRGRSGFATGRTSHRGNHQATTSQSGRYSGMATHHSEDPPYTPTFPGTVNYGTIPGRMQPLPSYNGIAQWSHQPSPFYPPSLPPRPYVAPGVQSSLGPSPGAYINPQFAMIQMLNGNTGPYFRPPDQGDTPR